VPGVGDATDQLQARPDFALLIYPAYLVQRDNDHALAREVEPGQLSPPTFLVQAEDDPIKVENSLVYYGALKEANVSAELHLYAHGGHGFGLRPTKLPVTHWPELASTWLHTLGVTP
jgi:acetyl esterase/lipase